VYSHRCCDDLVRDVVYSRSDLMGRGSHPLPIPHFCGFSL
jgi:hypothetical protein